MKTKAKRWRIVGIVYLFSLIFLLAAGLSNLAQENPGAPIWTLLPQPLLGIAIMGFPGALVVYFNSRTIGWYDAVLAYAHRALKSDDALQGGMLLWRTAAELSLKEKKIRKILSAAEEEGEISIPGSLSAPASDGPMGEEAQWLWDHLHETAIPFANLSLGSEISQKRWENARASFAQTSEGEVPLALVDSTVASSGKEGLLITDRGVHWKDWDSKNVGFLSYQELPMVSPMTESWTSMGVELGGVVTLKVASGAPDAAVARLAAFLNQARTRAQGGSMDAAPEELETVPTSSGAGEDQPALAEEGKLSGATGGDVGEAAPGQAPAEEPGWRTCLVKEGRVYCDCPACGQPKSWPFSIFSPGSQETAPEIRSTERVLPFGREIVGLAASFGIACVVGVVIAVGVGETHMWITFLCVVIFMGLRPILVPIMMPKLPVWEVTCEECGAGFQLAVGESEVVMNDGVLEEPVEVAEEAEAFDGEAEPGTPDVESAATASDETETAAPAAKVDTDTCAHCGATFYRPRTMLEKTDFQAMQRVRVGCSQCGSPVCFGCAATAADEKGQSGNCLCPLCDVDLGRGGEAGDLGEHFAGWD